MFDLIGFTYVLRLSTIIQDLLRYHHRIFRFLFKTIEIEQCVGTTKSSFEKWGRVLSNMLKMFDFQFFEIYENEKFRNGLGICLDF